MDDREAFEAATTGFYKEPDVQRATAALRHWLQLVATVDEGSVGSQMVLFYLFARIAQVYDARASFESVLGGYSGPRNELPRQLLQLIRAGGRTIPNALEIPIERPENLDLLWAEFFVTGRSEPLERIFTTLDRPDRMRARLEAWLAERSLFGGGKRRTVANRLAAAGIVVDVERKMIETKGDLDCACFAIAERRVPIFKILPFQITPDEATALGIKGAAIWSLRLNARDHARVAEAVRVEVQRPGGPARLLVSESTANGPSFSI